MDRLEKNETFVKRLLKNKEDPQLIKREISRANNSEICALCEIIKNLIHNPNIAVSKERRIALKKYKQELKTLINRRVNKRRKRQILQKGAGVLLPLILSTVAPLVYKLISGGQ